MKNCFILFRRAGVYYYEDTTTGRQLSLRTKIESETPTRFSRQIKDGRIVVITEHTYIRVSAGSVTCKIGCRQVVAGIERMVSDAGYSVVNSNTDQTGAAKKCLTGDIRDAIGNRDMGQLLSLSNAESPMLVTLLGIVALLRLVQ